MEGSWDCTRLCRVFFLFALRVLRAKVQSVARDQGMPDAGLLAFFQLEPEHKNM